MDHNKDVNRRPVYENWMCKSVGLRASCNACDAIIWEGEKFYEGGYCETCAKDVKRVDGKPLEEIETIV